MATNKLKVQTYTVMHSGVEKIDGKKVKPYQSFTTAPTEELEEKVKKGWLIHGEFNPESPKSSRRSSSKKSARKK